MTQQRLGSTGLKYNKEYLSFTWHKVQKYAFQGQCSCPVTWIQALPIFLLCHHLLLVFASPLCCPVVIRWLRQPQTSCPHSMGLCKKRNKKQRKQGRVFLIATSVVLPVWRGPGGSFPSRAPSRSHDYLLLPKRLGRGLPALTLLISIHHLNSKLGVLLTKTDSYGGCISTSGNAKQPVRKKPGFLKKKFFDEAYFLLLK